LWSSGRSACWHIAFPYQVLLTAIWSKKRFNWVHFTNFGCDIKKNYCLST
jgi:hypothetical protein